MKPVLEAVNVSKIIDGRTILKDISLLIKENQAIAIQGKNGSGKSTLLKLFAGIYEPTTGKVERSQTKIGYVPEHFPENLPFRVIDYLSLVTSFQIHSKQKVEQSMKRYIDLLEINPFLNVPLKQCSKGTKQKVGLIQALLREPSILFLDEPLTGLDVATQSNLQQLLETLKKEMVIIFTTHGEELVDQLADQLFLLEGQTISNFEKKVFINKKRIKIKYKNEETISNHNLLYHDPDEKIALLTIDPFHSDELLLEFLQKGCSILEVREDAGS
ncbi:metal ABC transporter ATP-binding protein [Bacillus niameyensis]|uniref:metal ABC transporter ATP-binding protein n=1 Tax=Bacillus niameyensis TaxID=1522308 RepID=UPI000780EFE8|nr:ABC transporter ATP-binding protein [Bacillus niameyensis]